ncbi:Ser/Arg-rich splicing factor [Gracilaria domingensis]|nr:Ser/Arg-rich splicing factor [Gracilaria domingensis]
MTITGTPLQDFVEAKSEGEREGEEDPNNVRVKLYISGLPPRIDSAALRRAIEEFGEVYDSRVVVDRVTGRSRGFGFVTVRGRSTAAAVIDVLSDDSRRLGTRLKSPGHGGPIHSWNANSLSHPGLLNKAALADGDV